MYRQWHELAFILSELCVRPASPVAHRAFSIVNVVYRGWLYDGPPKGWVLWEPLSRLMERVAVNRASHPATSENGLPKNIVPISFPVDSSHIASIWTSQGSSSSVTSTAAVSQDAEPDTPSMDIYKGIMRDADADSFWD